MGRGGGGRYGGTTPVSLSTLLGKPSNKNTYSGVTDISWERSVDIRYEADVIIHTMMR